ncbi:N-acetylglucosamine-1-phosphotransferase subunits alpha/beta [Anopheles aquasalis]|uniref:N-acetylglucosamine-1-phosphotransferase subunits alpha/beta n=1 Tax=Anopheles aquasalis TaxID=42839 RepID=UPI00215A2BCB|nr:N-acetylglucosamine-1-phosphotransferase subunits alpha/beta [Anopheles aquasalis]
MHNTHEMDFTRRKRLVARCGSSGVRTGKFRFRACCIVTLLALLTISYIILSLLITHTSKHACQNCYEVIDVVYTWVNGSDPSFLAQLSEYSPRQYDKARYDDKNELRYSLRSLEKYAPWVRNVYIVTNGQVPGWLNLEHPRLRLITHAEIADDDTALPTYSSAAIETFIHRIPGLSRQFLYLNDDIFLGAPLYPDDLQTLAEGVKVFTAWIVPDCAPDCPWMFVGDGSCDHDCHVEACQFDGGDCDHPDYGGPHEGLHLHDQSDYGDAQEDPPDEEPDEAMFIEVPKIFPRVPGAKGSRTLGNQRSENIRDIYEIFRKRTAGNDTSSTRQLVERFNQEKMKSNKQQQHHHGRHQRLPQDRKQGAHQRSANGTMPAKSSSQDMFAQSLIHSNRVFNLAYGFHHRKVLAHVGFLLDVEIIERMLERFRKEFRVTKQHRFRAENDMQYAFSYYHFLMSETRNKTVGEIFDDFDTDSSGTWSDREIRTLLAKVYSLPLDWSAVRFFEEVVTNCSLQQNNYLPLEHQQDQRRVYPTLVYERYEDSTIPTVTRALVMACGELADMLRVNFGKVPRYRFHVSPKTAGLYSNFKMLTSNITQVVDALDELRKSPKKFNCINDNLSGDRPEENQLVAALLEDFYLSLFPARSSFELEAMYRNRFQYYDEYRSWLRRKLLFRNSVYIVCAAVFLVCVRLLCCRHKGKFARTLLLLGAARSNEYTNIS